MVETEFQYVGAELDVFSIAVNWKRYWSTMMLPYLGKRVLEVGAGIGSSTAVLASMGNAREWLCLEPDPNNIEILRGEKRLGNLPAYCEFQQGTIESLRAEGTFDSILYIDVLEHIQDDEREIASAAARLTNDGHMIILAPAYPFLFSEFDESIGHHRRYTRSMFPEKLCEVLERVTMRYLDSVGLLASLGNRLMLRESLPTKGQLLFWDRYMVPISRVTDRIFGYRFGRSILVVYRKTPTLYRHSSAPQS